MDYSFLKANPLYVFIAFIVFHLLVGRPLLELDLIQSLILFVIFYAIYMKYGKKYIQRSAFGKRR